MLSHHRPFRGRPNDRTFFFKVKTFVYNERSICASRHILCVSDPLSEHKHLYRRGRQYRSPVCSRKYLPLRLFSCIVGQQISVLYPPYAPFLIHLLKWDGFRQGCNNSHYAIAIFSDQSSEPSWLLVRMKPPVRRQWTSVRGAPDVPGK